MKIPKNSEVYIRCRRQYHQERSSIAYFFDSYQNVRVFDILLSNTQLLIFMKLRYDNFLNRPQFCHAILLKYYFGMMCRKGRRRENEMTKQDNFIDFGEKYQKR